MSMYFKRTLIFCALLICIGSNFSIAQDYYTPDSAVAINPTYVDSLYKTAPESQVLDSAATGLSVFRLPDSIKWDVQQLNRSTHIHAVYFATLLILLLFVIIKLGYQEFFFSSLSSLPNGKVFQLYFRSKKFSSVIPLFIFFLIRVVILSIVAVQIVYILTGNDHYTKIQFLFMWTGIISGFYFLRYIIEYVVTEVIGVGSVFKQYLTEYTIITGWVWLPILILSILAGSNSFEYTPRLFFILLGLILVLGSTFAHIRSIEISTLRNISFLIHFFIYFCTFKILPYLILVKWLSKNWILFS